MQFDSSIAWESCVVGELTRLVSILIEYQIVRVVAVFLLHSTLESFADTQKQITCSSLLVER